MCVTRSACPRLRPPCRGIGGLSASAARGLWAAAGNPHCPPDMLHKLARARDRRVCSRAERTLGDNRRAQLTSGP